MTAVPFSDERDSDERVMSSNRLELAMILAGALFMLIALIAAVLL